MKVLAISVHPDDETLGCGGSLLHHRNEGDSLYWLVVTAPYQPAWSAETVESKSREVDIVASAYGFERVYRLGFPTVRLDVVPNIELIDGIRSVIAEVKPEVVYLVHGGDVHTDHHAVFIATMSVIKAFYMRELEICRILSYETLSSTDAAPPQFQRAFIPNIYRNITPYIDEKIAIMNHYQSEIQDELWPRGDSSIRALARYRGATIGVEYAEAFMLIREVC